MVEATVVLDAIVAVSIAAGALFAIMELRDMRKDRRIELLLQANAPLATKEFMDAACKILRSNVTDPNELEKQVSYSELHMVAQFLEGTAHLGTQSLVDKRMLTRYFLYDYFWKKMSLWILAERRATGISLMYADFEKLAQLQERQAGGPSPRKGP